MAFAVSQASGDTCARTRGWCRTRDPDQLVEASTGRRERRSLSCTQRHCVQVGRLFGPVKRKQSFAAGVDTFVSHVGCGALITMRLVRQQNLEQLTLVLTRCTLDRVEELANRHAVSREEILRTLIANALGVEAELARRYDELSGTLDQGRAPMSLEKREAADQAVSRAMASILELEEYAVMRAFVER